MSDIDLLQYALQDFADISRNDFALSASYWQLKRYRKGEFFNEHSGSIDNIVPAHLDHRNFEAYKNSGSVLDYKEFPGRNHFVLGQPTWKENADYFLDWLAKHA